MRTTPLWVSAVLLSLAATAPAQAKPDTIRLHLRAEVAPFCKIWVDGSDQINVVDGKAEIGNVREVCNTRYGYNIKATFLNLNAGTLTAGGESTAIDNFGLAEFNYGQAGASTRFWRLSDATPVVPASPVYMQVVISPI